MKIAVVGTGISGLAAGWMLHRHAEVTVYEKNSYPGGHTNTVTVSDGAGTLAVDTGFIVFNELNYPNLTALFRLLGVGSHPSEMSFSASIDDGRVEWSGDNLNTLFAQRQNLLSRAHWRMLRDILRFNREGKRALETGLDPDLSLGEFLDIRDYGPELRYRYLLPMAAAIWSCPMDRMLEFSANSFLRFCNNHCLLNLMRRPQWRTVTGGGREYVKRLAKSLAPDLHLNRAVTVITRTPTGVQIQDQHGEWCRYDEVVVAAHGDQTLKLLADASPQERAVLGAFQYQTNRAVLHTDARSMPKSRRVWASWNYFGEGEQRHDARVSLTYWMNRLQDLRAQDDYFVTLNPVREPSPGSVLYETTYEHPVFNRETVRAQDNLQLIQGRNRTWFCGAWCGHGFHEDGLKSAADVVERMGYPIPWRKHYITRRSSTTDPWAVPALEDM
ncbi:MAG: NAD(P)/FAD-dependent oxidoreductase [Candidatus Dormibacteraceae bacterium]